MKFIFIFLSIVVGSVIPGEAQVVVDKTPFEQTGGDTLWIRLQEAILIALDRNPNMAMQRLEPVIAKTFVDEQRAFQERIRPALQDHSRYGPALAEESLANAFRLLQIWDLLSLLLLMRPLSTNTVEDVPVAGGKRTTIQLTPHDERTLAIDPYPFGEAPFTVRADGRWLAQQTFRHNALFRRALAGAQVVELEFVVERAD